MGSKNHRVLKTQLIETNKQENIHSNGLRLFENQLNSFQIIWNITMADVNITNKLDLDGPRIYITMGDKLLWPNKSILQIENMPGPSISYYYGRYITMADITMDDIYCNYIDTLKSKQSLS